MPRYIVLLAKSAIAAAPLSEMQRMADETAAVVEGAIVTFAFTEQGVPSFKDRLDEIAGQGARDITLVPLILPMEPGMTAWLAKAIHRWRAAADRPDVVFRIAPPPSAVAAMAEVIAITARQGLAAEPVVVAVDKPLGSVVPDHQARVLVCQGGPCNDAGAALVWGHLRNEQLRLGLREAASMMSARTSCLGPCNLAPVVQVYPQGVYYGGVDEAGIDRIIAEHLMQGEVVRDLAYDPLPGKQRLRD